ncbi:MAG: S-adenosylmethionine decarboxylase [Patescibacteria group bacterium]|nr:S-adenosylmethionine decarboxylase [bacterium]MDZ4240836.1 S-adenosylmethionine decarboxylase [Patescibacteria group bacterium]
MNNEFWGYHLILDCAQGDRSKVSDKKTIKAFIEKLVPSIGMKAYGEPMIEHFATHAPKAAGYSLVQLIETSAVTGHFSDMTGDFYLDVFSCKQFDSKKAQEVVNLYFAPQQMRVTFLTRQA